MSVNQCTVNIPIIGGFRFVDKINSLNVNDIGWLAFFKFISKGVMMLIGIIVSALIFQLRMNLSEYEFLYWIRPKINTGPIEWMYGFGPAFVLLIVGAVIYAYCTNVVSRLQTDIMKRILSKDTRPCKDSTGFVWTPENTVWQTLLSI